MWLEGLGKRKAGKRGQVVSETLWRSEADGIPAGIANILNWERVNVAGAQYVVVLGTLFAVRVVGEMLGASAFRERRLNRLKNLVIGWHRCEVANFLIWLCRSQPAKFHAATVLPA